jgi:uncharacterized protein (UPF0335 family)
MPYLNKDLSYPRERPEILKRLENDIADLHKDIKDIKEDISFIKKYIIIKKERENKSWF